MPTLCTTCSGRVADARICRQSSAVRSRPPPANVPGANQVSLVPKTRSRNNEGPPANTPAAGRNGAGGFGHQRRGLLLPGERPRRNDHVERRARRELSEELALLSKGQRPVLVAPLIELENRKPGAARLRAGSKE